MYHNPNILLVCQLHTAIFGRTRWKTTTDTREKWVTSLVLALEQWFALWNIYSSQRQKILKTSAWPANRNVKRVLNPNKPDGWHVWVWIRSFSFLLMFHFHCCAVPPIVKVWALHSWSAWIEFLSLCCRGEEDGWRTPMTNVFSRPNINCAVHSIVWLRSKLPVTPRFPPVVLYICRCLVFECHTAPTLLERWFCHRSIKMFFFFHSALSAD